MKTNLKPNTVIRCHSKAEQIAAAHMLAALNGNCKICEYMLEKPYEEFPFVCFGGDSIIGYPKKMNALDFNEITTEQKYREVILSDSYTAKVYADKVKVGCQTFAINKIREILKASEKLAK